MATLTELITVALQELIQRESEEGWSIPYRGGTSGTDTAGRWQHDQV